MTNPTETDVHELPPKKTKQDFDQEGKFKGRSLFFHYLKTLVFVLVSSFLVAFSANSLIAPNNFAIGGVTGIAIIIEHLTGGKIPQSVSLMSINLPLIVIAFFGVKKRFAFLTLLNVLFQTFWLEILRRYLNIPLVFEEKIFAALAGGIGIGTGIALAFKIGGSTGGMDIIAMLAQKKIASSSIAWILFALNCTVIACSFFAYRKPTNTTVQNLLPLIMAICEQYAESKINDVISNGFHSAIEFRVITDKPDEMAYAIISKLGRGVTSIPATGMYTHENHAMLVCVINRRQIAAFRKILKSVDPDSFAVMTNVSQVLGLGFFAGDN